MPFVPYRRGNANSASVVRNLLFWVLMVFLAIVLWQMTSKGGRPAQGSPLSYSDFMNQVDASNIRTATLAVMQNTADVSGELKQPVSDYRSTVPRDTLPALLSKLRQQGADVQVKEGAASGNWINFLVGVAPIILLVALWIFMMRQMQSKKDKNEPGQPSAGAIG